MRRLIIALCVALFSMAALVVGGLYLVPRALADYDLLNAADDPVKLASLRLPDLATESRIGAEIDEAVRQEDPELAESFIKLANSRGISVSAERRSEVKELESFSGRRTAADFFKGLTSQPTGTLAGNIGAVASDVLYSDVVDVWQEGNKLRTGAPYDKVRLGLAVAGLAADVSMVLSYGGTVVTAGAASPLAATSTGVRTGLTGLKVAAKLGRLSRGLVETIVRLSEQVVDRGALIRGLQAARGLDVGAARQAARDAVRPDAFKRLRNLGKNAADIESRIGQRGTLEVLGITQNEDEFGKSRRLTEAFGNETRAVVKLLGGDALRLGVSTKSVLLPIWLGGFWLLAVVVVALWLGTIVFRLKNRSTHARVAV